MNEDVTVLNFQLTRLTASVIISVSVQNDLHASRTGVVESIDVAQGEQVKYGQVLLRFAKD